MKYCFIFYFIRFYSEFTLYYFINTKKREKEKLPEKNSLNINRQNKVKN